MPHVPQTPPARADDQEVGGVARPREERLDDRRGEHLPAHLDTGRDPAERVAEGLVDLGEVVYEREDAGAHPDRVQRHPAAGRLRDARTQRRETGQRSIDADDHLRVLTGAHGFRLRRVGVLGVLLPTSGDRCRWIQTRMQPSRPRAEMAICVQQW
jgi:hypothetical protein